MTTKDWRKAFKQLKVKPVKLKKYIKHNAPKKRTTGQNTVSCSRCGQHRGHNKKYTLDMCRQCFRKIAPRIGFKRYS
jgi:small subunit ribosomal protein S14